MTMRLNSKEHSDYNPKAILNLRKHMKAIISPVMFINDQDKNYKLV